MAIFCLYASPSGVAKTVELTPHAVDAEPLRETVGLARARAMLLFSGEPRQGKWHTTPNLGLTVVIEGTLTIEVNQAAPEKIEVAKGDLLFVLDNQGEGHRSEASVGLSALLLPLDPQALNTLANAFTNWPTEMRVASD